jgi:2-methylcitrate dehydratase PrpD
VITPATTTFSTSTELAAVLGAERLLALDEDLVDVARRRVFDTLGALTGGRRVVASRALAGLNEGAARGGLLERVRDLVAAARCSEVDDIDRGSCTTPGSVAVPVALAVGAARGAADRDVLAGVVAGYEAMIRFGDSIDGARTMYRGVWPSYVAAPFAAAATTARVLGLDTERTTHALAIAATRTPGFAGKIAEDATSRWLTYGCAAADGVLAALAAEAGMAGDPRALDVGLPAAAAFDVDAGRFADDHAGAWRIERIDTKPICTARQAQSAVEAVQRAAAALGDRASGGLELIEVGLPAAYRGMVDQPAVSGRLASILSVQFQVAAALTREELLYDIARDDLALSQEGQRIMRELSVVVVDELTPLFPAVWPARVRLRTRSGDERVIEVHHPIGSAERPLDWAGLDEKYARMHAWDDETRARIGALCQGLDTDVDSPRAAMLNEEMDRDERR